MQNIILYNINEHCQTSQSCLLVINRVFKTTNENRRQEIYVHICTYNIPIHYYMLLYVYEDGGKNYTYFWRSITCRDGSKTEDRDVVIYNYLKNESFARVVN